MSLFGEGEAEVTTEEDGTPAVVAVSALRVELIVEALLLGSLVALGVLSRVETVLLLVVSGALLDVSPDVVEDSKCLVVPSVAVANLGWDPVVPGAMDVDEM